MCVVSVVCVVCVVGVSRVQVRNVSVCRFKTHPCVPAKRAHVELMCAFCRHTRMRFEPTHGDVLSIHTGRRGKGGGGGVGWGGGGRGSLLSLFLFSLPALVVSLLSQQQ